MISVHSQDGRPSQQNRDDATRLEHNMTASKTLYCYCTLHIVAISTDHIFCDFLFFSTRHLFRFDIVVPSVTSNLSGGTQTIPRKA